MEPELTDKQRLIALEDRVAELESQMHIAAGELHKQLDAMSRDYHDLVTKWKEIADRMPPRQPPRKARLN